MARIHRLENGMETLRDENAYLRAQNEELHARLDDDVREDYDQPDAISTWWDADTDELVVGLRTILTGGMGSYPWNRYPSYIHLRFDLPVAGNAVYVYFYACPWRTVSNRKIIGGIGYSDNVTFTAVEYTDTPPATFVSSYYAPNNTNAEYMRHPDSCTLSQLLLGTVVFKDTGPVGMSDFTAAQMLLAGIDFSVEPQLVTLMSEQRHWPEFVMGHRAGRLPMVEVTENQGPGVAVVNIGGLQVYIPAAGDKDIYLVGDYGDDLELTTVNTGAAAPAPDWRYAKLGRVAVRANGTMERVDLGAEDLRGAFMKQAPGKDGTIAVGISDSASVTVLNGLVTDWTVTPSPGVNATINVPEDNALQLVVTDGVITGYTVTPP